MACHKTNIYVTNSLPLLKLVHVYKEQKKNLKKECHFHFYNSIIAESSFLKVRLFITYSNLLLR
jgi:hypothetical protein